MLNFFEISLVIAAVDDSGQAYLAFPLLGTYPNGKVDFRGSLRLITLSTTAARA
jgi:hypothetical protein